MRAAAIFIVSAMILAMSSCGDFFTHAMLQSISISPPSPVIGQGNTIQMTANGVNDDGSTRTVTGVTWTSSNTGIATVDGSGVVTAVAVGSATITATSGAITGTTNINVLSANLSSITVSPAVTSISPGQQQTFTATANLSNGQTADITSMVTWTSSDKTIATITNAGVATAQSLNTSATATITATSGNISGTATLTVI